MKLAYKINAELNYTVVSFVFNYNLTWVNAKLLIARVDNCIDNATNVMSRKREKTSPWIVRE